MTPTVTAILTSAMYTAAHPLIMPEGWPGVCAGVVLIVFAALAVVWGNRKARL